MLETRFRLKEPQIVSQEVESEIIAINMNSGTYYNLRGIAAEVWSHLVKGCLPKDIGGYYAEQDGVESDKFAGSLSEFILQLVEEELIEPSTLEDGSGSTLAEFQTKLSAKDLESFEVNKFTDMQEFLLVDPIHDVTGEGWPFVNHEPEEL